VNITGAWTRDAATACGRCRDVCSRALGRHRRLAIGLACAALAALAAVAPVAMLFAHVYRDRSNLPDLGTFVRFEFLAIGHIYDATGQPVISLARERRLITKYEDLPPVVRDAVVSTEDRRFFTHNGVDYRTVPRVLVRVRTKTLLRRLLGRGSVDEAKAPAIFPQGGSTITQQLVRGHFLKGLTEGENSRLLRGVGRLTRTVSYVLGARNANMIARKIEEMRLSIWVEQEMTRRFGSKRRAKEEILARYVSFVYMSNGQYGFATAAQYYFGRPLATFTATDADKAALLAGIPKSPRAYAPTAVDSAKVLRRRNQTLALMMANGSLTSEQLADAVRRPIPALMPRPDTVTDAPAAVGNVLAELKAAGVADPLDDLLQGRMDVHTTVDLRVQHIVNTALEHGIAAYEKRHPRTKGIVQGSVVVLSNGNARVLAEAGGRQFYHDRSASYNDFNRATESLRQPGSAMKPFVYLAAFRNGLFDLGSIVPDEPISVPDIGVDQQKWIANYDGRFKGLIPLRQALAESRNAAAIWIATEIGIDSVLGTSRRLGVQTPLHRSPTTALGASEVNLLELANAYRAMASGVIATPFVVRTVVRGSAAPGVNRDETRDLPAVGMDKALLLIQEGLRGVVRMPSGTAHALDSPEFPIAVMGKTGTTNEFRDALFLGSTYGRQGITVAVRIGFDDNRSLGAGETGARLALPVFREVMLGIYRDQLAGPVPSFPASLEGRITAYLDGNAPTLSDPVRVQSKASTLGLSATYSRRGSTVIRSGAPHTPLPAESTWLLERGAVTPRVCPGC
jgi:penicillin-binding protein 1A